MDITDIILDQHDQQRRLFAVLEEYPRDDTDGLAAIWQQLEKFLVLHAEAEEETFYRDLAKVGTGGADAEDNAEQIEDAIKDHNDLRDAIRKVRRCKTGSDAWWTAVVDANVYNSHHMAEEERQDLADFRQQASLALRHECAVAFLRYLATSWDAELPLDNHDPEEYVEQAQAAPQGPSAEAAAALADEQTPTQRSADPEPSVKASPEAAEEA